MAHHFILLWLNTFDLRVVGRDGGLSTLCHSCRFACQQRVLKTFPGPGYLHSKDGVVWLWHSLVNLYIWLTISSCYYPIPLILGLIGRDGGLSTLCHSHWFARQQRVLKTFHGPGYLCSQDAIIYIYMSKSTPSWEHALFSQEFTENHRRLYLFTKKSEICIFCVIWCDQDGVTS